MKSRRKDVKSGDLRAQVSGCTGDLLKVTGSSFETESDTNGCSLKLSEA